MKRKTTNWESRKDVIRLCENWRSLEETTTYLHEKYICTNLCDVLTLELVDLVDKYPLCFGFIYFVLSARHLVELLLRTLLCKNHFRIQEAFPLVKELPVLVAFNISSSSNGWTPKLVNYVVWWTKIVKWGEFWRNRSWTNNERIIAERKGFQHE